MELELKKRRLNIKMLPPLAGFLSFLSGIISLASLNIGLLMNVNELPEFLLLRLPLIGLALGVLGLFTRKSSRLSAIWGISLCLFIYLFIFLMFGLSWMINAKP